MIKFLIGLGILSAFIALITFIGSIVCRWIYKQFFTIEDPEDLLESFIVGLLIVWCLSLIIFLSYVIGDLIFL